jgi:hypothetical protein
VIVDLHGNQPGFIEGAPDCCFLFAAPFLPETDRARTINGRMAATTSPNSALIPQGSISSSPPEF